MSEWIEPPVEVVDELARWGSFGADAAVIASKGQVSSVPAPDGSGQGLTAAEATMVAVRAAIRLLLANGLIEPRLPVGGMMIECDPPGGWSP